MYHQAGCNTWRNFKDIDNHWESLSEIILHWADYWHELQNIPTGSFNDADMLIVGDDHYGTMLPRPQAQLQMGFWAMIASPLLIGGDVRTIPEEYRKILVNQHIIAVNQDVSRKQAYCVVGCKGTTNTDDDAFEELRTTSALKQVWSKTLQGGHSQALGFFNLQEDDDATIQYIYQLEGVVAQCVDLWSDDPNKDLCAQGKGATTQQWDIHLLTKDDNHYSLQIQALEMEPTSHRMLRIDYYCDNSNQQLTFGGGQVSE
eukprot:Sro800_g204290.2  (259) ;mRNA; r:19491-20267